MNDTYYYIAKAIAEEFEWQEDCIEELQEKVPVGKQVRYTVARRTVTYDVESHKVHISTSFFDEFRTPTKIYSWDQTEKFKGLGIIADYGKVIGMYFRYFHKDYDCSFELKDW